MVTARNADRGAGGAVLRASCTPADAGRPRARTGLVLPVALLIGGVYPPVTTGSNGDSVSVYGAVNFEERIVDLVRELSPTFQSSYLYAVTWVRPWAESRHVRWEIEGQLARHSGMQQLWEINVVPIARWKTTPWDGFVDTRFAVGWGLSWASEVPPIEPRQEEESGEGESARLLSYNLFEVEFMPPEHQEWSGFVRLHHRSGVGGLFGGVEGGSNFLAVGLRHYF